MGRRERYEVDNMAKSGAIVQSPFKDAVVKGRGSKAKTVGGKSKY